MNPNIVFGEAVSKWVCEGLGGTYRGGEQGLGLLRDGELVAGVTYYHNLRRSICMSIFTTDRRWANRDYLYAVFAYPFVQLKVNKVLALIDSGNTNSMRLVGKHGARKEAVIEGAGKSGDLVIWSMAASHCKWLRRV